MFQPYIIEEDGQDTASEVFFGISNLCHETENENWNEDIRVHYYNFGKAITSLYILNDAFQSSRDEITELVNQLLERSEEIAMEVPMQFFKLLRLF